MTNLISIEDLKPQYLDYLVALYFKKEPLICKDNICYIEKQTGGNTSIYIPYSPTKKWSQCGPLIESYDISIENMIDEVLENEQGYPVSDYDWAAYFGTTAYYTNKTTCFAVNPTLAAVKCFVKRFYGERINTTEINFLEIEV